MMMDSTVVNRVTVQALTESDSPEVIDTRFGKIVLQKEKPLVFPRGLLGMPRNFNFFMTEFPSVHMKQFKMLQSLDDYSLSFITLPIDWHNTFILPEDLSTASRELGIVPENLAVLLVVSVHRAARVAISVNARAPILVDTAARLAAQYVFTTDRYSVQHFINK